MHQQNPLPFTTPTGRAQIVAHIRRHPLGREPQEQRANFVRLTLGTANGSAQPARQSIALGGAGTRGTLVYFHGGGYSFGSPQTHERIGRALAQRSGLRVVLPAYPLAPEARWPAQLDAAVVAVRREARAHDAPVLLAGDSAGGHLALVTALALARVGKPVAGLLLFSPNTDRSGLSRTRERNDALDPMVDDAGDRALAQRCFGALPVLHPQVSPLLDDMSLLPPLYIEVGAQEVLLDDSRLLARRARQAGRPVTLHVVPNGLHMGQLWTPWWPQANASLDRAADFIRSTVGAKRASAPLAAAAATEMGALP